jgi:SAM-dependent methyltransferase
VGTLEHCRRAERVLAEAARVLRSEGEISLRTTNRFSLLREPHVDVWGVGFVPRRWADAYVRWRGGTGYEHHRCLSAGELARSLRDAGFSSVKVAAARLLTADRPRLGRAMQTAGPVYQWARAAPFVSAGLRWISPLLEARGKLV